MEKSLENKTTTKALYTSAIAIFGSLDYALCSKQLQNVAPALMSLSLTVPPATVGMRRIYEKHPFRNRMSRYLLTVANWESVNCPLN